ncbi:unnamed protein product [Meloidogyne enterolobii]|uniref:Uncharacterized protein n=1 Tax=Meloidogyne enterolobii TaxID=390850 RepID=A0ACB1AYU0_MELEN
MGRRSGRSASPRSSGPVRRAPSSPMRTTTPATVPPPAPQQRQPGLLGQMAATAGGVAIGSAVGHAVGNMFSGGRSAEQEQQPMYNEQQSGGQKQYSNDCEVEWRQFLDCTERQNDVSFCQSFNDLLKDCKARMQGDRLLKQMFT